MAYFLLEALLVALSVSAFTVAGLRCPCLVQGEVCGNRGQNCWKTAWVGDRDSYYDSLVPLWVKQSVAEDGNAGEKRKQELRDNWESGMALARETLWGWPACRHGFCDISHNNSVYEVMQILQFESRSKAPADDVVLACVNASILPAVLFYKRFVGCGIVPADASKRVLNDECKDAGGMLSFGRREYPNGSYTFCIHNFTTAPANDAAVASQVFAPTVPVSALHQTSRLVCPCQINATIAFGDRSNIRVVSSPSDDLASLTKALQSRAAKARVCNYASDSHSDCNFERSYEELLIPFWPGCHNGRCEITRGAGEIWELMSDYQGHSDGVPACITAVVANDTANGRRLEDGIHDLVRFRGCGIIPKEMVTPEAGTFCKLQMGVHGDEHLCIIEYETASKSAASGKFPWLVLLLATLPILAVASALVVHQLTDLGDFYVGEFHERLETLFEADVAKDFPDLRAHYKKVGQLPGMAKRIASRPQMPL